MDAVKGKRYEATVRTLWGLAKCPELQLSAEDLHLIVQVQTGKDSMRELTKREIQHVASVLGQMKDSARKGKRREPPAPNSTSRQIQKIHALERELGWDNPARLMGFCKRMFRTESVQWLSYQQCSDLIEALKKMLERKRELEGNEADEGLQPDGQRQE